MRFACSNSYLRDHIGQGLENMNPGELIVVNDNMMPQISSNHVTDWQREEEGRLIV